MSAYAERSGIAGTPVACVWTKVASGDGPVLPDACVDLIHIPGRGAFVAGPIADRFGRSHAMLVAATLFFVELARREYTPEGNKYASRVLAVGAVMHAINIVIGSFVTNTCPVESLPFALSLSAR